jgi:hypothetical protein
MPIPHAYVVEYRVADACFPPACAIGGNSVFGRVTSDPAGGYVTVGTDKDELFAKRGMVVAPANEISFTLPRVDAGSVFDASLSAVDPSGGSFRAVLEVRSDHGALASRTFAGTTAAFEATTDPRLLGREERYFLHLREPLPENSGPTTFVLRNEGSIALGLGAPLVMRRVDGRKARQAILVFFDAVPHPVFAELYQGTEPSSRWVSQWVKRGVLFPQAISPGQLTGSFVRRFFRADYYRLDGDPSLAGQGFDETPPERAPGPVARLAEQGFFTEALASNLYLSPLLSRVGFDSDYNIESTIELQVHPEVLAARFAREIAIHGADDALFVVWFANTHAPWRDGRPGAPPLRLSDGAKEELDLDVLDPIWRNLLDAVDALQKIVRSADASGGAERVWVLGADHGHTFTLASRARPWRLTHEAVENGHMHCCLATAEEARTFLAIAGDDDDGALQPVETRPLSTLAVWSEIERRFGVKLDLPETSAFALPGAPGVFDDRIVVSVGNSGALFGRSGDLSYRSYQPAPNLSPAWKLGPKMSRLLFGSPEPAGDIPSEELYDLVRDPREKDNLAELRFDDLLDMRRRMTDWLAEYADGPEHERYLYHVDFAGPVELSIRAPRAFSIQIDGDPAKRYPGVAHASGTSFALRDGDQPVGVVDVAGAATTDGLVVRCAASGMPLAMIDRDHPRFNLALARTNCVGGASAGTRSATPGEAFFRAELVDRKSVSATGGGVRAPELRNALQRWGYVRDK